MVWKDGFLWSLNNRRLYVFRVAHAFGCCSLCPCYITRRDLPSMDRVTNRWMASRFGTKKEDTDIFGIVLIRHRINRASYIITHTHKQIITNIVYIYMCVYNIYVYLSYCAYYMFTSMSVCIMSISYDMAGHGVKVEHSI